MGAAGLTSSSVEMASKGGVGIELDLDLVPVREDAMTAYEIMLSESQERMLMVLRPGAEDAARAVFEKWGLDFAVDRPAHRYRPAGARAGRRDRGRHPARPAGRGRAALYDRAPCRDPGPTRASRFKRVADGIEPIAALERLIGCPDLCSRRWIWEQYDHMVMGDSVAPAGRRRGDRARPWHRQGARRSPPTARRATVAADPDRRGGMQAVAEAWRNLTAVGARPLALTDNLNFGNPEKPEIMGQFIGCIEGMAEACLALDFPVVSGNVSLYNETEGRPILPTPVIGGLGLIADLENAAPASALSPPTRRSGADRG